MVSLRSVEVGRVLEAAASQSPVKAVEAVARELGEVFDAENVSLLIADLSGRALVRLAHVPLKKGTEGGRELLGEGERRDSEESATVLPFDGGPEEQAVRTQEVQVIEPGQRHKKWWRVLAPVTERGETVGLLEVHLRTEPSSETVEELALVAHLLALIVIANQRHTDLFEWGQRTRSFSLSAEIQQRLLPGPRTCEADAFTLSGWLEPARSVGGDTFDYSLDRDVLHLSLTDAMGHGVNAALTASLCLGSLRGARRRGGSLLEQAQATNTALAEHAASRDAIDYATGLLVRINLRTGTCEIVNAGHVAPYLIRDGEVAALELPANLPFGMFPDTRYDSIEATLQPGDRIVLVTDGMLEHNLEALDLTTVIAQHPELHPRELVRALADGALKAAGHELSDDATVMCLDWHGTHTQDRPTGGGADRDRASNRLPHQLAR